MRRAVPALCAQMMLFLWAIAAQSWAACDAQSAMLAVESADRAFATMDADAFSAAVLEMDEAVACAIDALSPTHVIAVHRTHALAAFFTGDDAATTTSFRAALATMPGFQLSDEIAPVGHPLRQRFEEAQAFADDGTVDLATPEEGWITVDGRRSEVAPAGRPFVFQRLLEDGTVAATVYVAVGSPVPTYPARSVPLLPAPGPVPMPEPIALSNPRPPPPSPPTAARGPKTVPFVVGLALEAVAAGLYGGAFVARARYNDARFTGTEDRIKSTHLTTNTLVGSSIGTAILGTSLVLVSF